jgi:hypothetical protein
VCRDSTFLMKLEVLFLTSRSITPRPTSEARVLVGRVEIITQAEEIALGEVVRTVLSHYKSSPKVCLLMFCFITAFINLLERTSRSCSFERYHRFPIGGTSLLFCFYL